MALSPFETLRQLPTAPPEVLDQLVLSGGLGALAITVVIVILLWRDKRRGIGRFKPRERGRRKSRKR